jgi:hypothetical protein
MPLTLACWVKTAAASGRYMSICNSTATAQRYAIDGAAGSGVRAVITQSSSSVFAASTGTIGSNVWIHACGVFASATSRSAYLNGAGKTTNTTSSSPSSITQASIGGDANGTTLLAGTIAFCAVWSAALIDSEVLSLASGESPWRIRPSNLVSYVRLTGVSPEPDLCFSTGWTLTGSPTVATNPLIYNP